MRPGESVGVQLLRPGEVVRVQSRHADGQVYRWYDATVEALTEHCVVAVAPPGRKVFQRGTFFHGRYWSRTYFWHDRLYNLNELCTPEHELARLYVHIASPPQLSPGVLSYTDYELDVELRVGGRPQVLDEAEFMQAALHYGYDAGFEADCWSAVAEALRLIQTWPAVLRPATPADVDFLRDMLYQAIYVPPGLAPPPREILRRPSLRRYVDGWGRPGDCAVLALDPLTRQSTGAAWYRLFTEHARGYGFVAESIPEVSMALVPPARGKGAGTAMLRRLISQARADGFAGLSLSVSLGNPARNLYERLGFRAVRVVGDAVTMLLAL